MLAEIEIVDKQLQKIMERQRQFFEDLFKEGPRYQFEDDDKDYSVAELDQLKSENYMSISKESDLDNAKSRLTFDQNFK